MDIYDCCYPGQLEPLDDERPIVIDASEEEEEEFEVDALSIDHFVSTPLFDAIQMEDWDAVDFFLDSGSFSFSPFHHVDEKTMAAVEDQVETWVDCRDEDGKLLWRQLPIHAALCFGAPHKTIKEIARIYPDALCYADNEGNLPLHLAVKFHHPDDVLLLVLKSYPAALFACNNQGEIPLECADYDNDKAGGMAARNELLLSFMEYKEDSTTKKLDMKESELRVVSDSAKRASKALAQAKKELALMKGGKNSFDSSRRGFARLSWNKKSSTSSSVSERKMEAMH